jgi:hypothetical protein
MIVEQMKTIFHHELNNKQCVILQYREAYSWEYTGELRETERVELDPLEEDEEIDL